MGNVTPSETPIFSATSVCSSTYLCDSLLNGALLWQGSSSLNILRFQPLLYSVPPSLSVLPPLSLFTTHVQIHKQSLLHTPTWLSVTRHVSLMDWGCHCSYSIQGTMSIGNKSPSINLLEITGFLRSCCNSPKNTLECSRTIQGHPIFGWETHIPPYQK